MRACVCKLVALALAAAIFCVNSPAEESIEYTIKASCLCKLLQFVEWPPEVYPEKNSPVIIGVLGNDPFGKLLDKAAQGQTIDAREVVVRRYKDVEKAREAQILFINLKGERLAAALHAMKGAAVLTVGDHASFIDSGGILEFAIRDDRISFNINQVEARNNGLKIGAQLLRLAQIVTPKGR